MEHQVKSFVEDRLNSAILFYSEQDGYSIEWQDGGGLLCLRIWPPEENSVLIEFHNVYHQSQVYLRDMTDTLTSLLPK